jgi:putative transposase
MNLSDAGAVVRATWAALPSRHASVTLDAFVVMPDHFHGIVILAHAVSGVGTSKQHGLAEVVRGFKSHTAREINIARNTPGAPVWQRNYYEQIIRNEDQLRRTRAYIAANPARWRG